MKRVKMNAKQEYEYVANYKIMQNVFKAKKIDKVSERPSLPSRHHDTLTQPPTFLANPRRTPHQM